jgi:hypothetical protein
MPPLLASYAVDPWKSCHPSAMSFIQNAPVSPSSNIGHNLHNAIKIPDILEENMTILDWAIHRQIPFNDSTNAEYLVVIAAFQKI